MTDDLFNWSAREHARTTDPSTSHEAADLAGDLARDQVRRCVAALYNAGPRGLTTHELADYLGIAAEKLTKRTSDCVRQGFAFPGEARRSGPANRRCTAWVHSRFGNGEPHETRSTGRVADLEAEVEQLRIALIALAKEHEHQADAWTDGGEDPDCPHSEYHAGWGRFARHALAGGE